MNAILCKYCMPSAISTANVSSELNVGACEEQIQRHYYTELTEVISVIVRPIDYAKVRYVVGMFSYKVSLFQPLNFQGLLL